MSGGLHGQAIMILSMASALNLADLMTAEEPGTATDLGVLEQSALYDAVLLSKRRGRAG